VDSGIEDDELFDASELDPAIALPSPLVYRGSLVALLLGSVFAVGLLVLPPVGIDHDRPPASIEGIVGGPVPTMTATVVPSVTATPTATAEATSTTTPAATAQPASTTTPVEAVIYTVRSGDTMSWIGEQFLPAERDLNQFIDEIAALNGIPDITQIQVGQVLEIPG
jgi:LysM repeat protein